MNRTVQTLNTVQVGSTVQWIQTPLETFNFHCLPIQKNLFSYKTSPYRIFIRCECDVKKFIITGIKLKKISYICLMFQVCIVAVIIIMIKVIYLSVSNIIPTGSTIGGKVLNWTKKVKLLENLRPKFTKWN